MKPFRLFLPLFFAFALLFAQQSGAAHALSHAFEQTRQQDKQTSHSACEQCATYAQLGSALNVGAYNFSLLTAPGEAVLYRSFAFRSIHVIAAAARGPPASLQKIA